MSAHEPDEPLLYHGTRAGFRGVGGLVLPGTEVGRHAHPGMEYRSDWVYVTPDLDLAWAYAYAARGRGKPKVLVVRPAGTLLNDDSTIGGGEEQVSFRCAYAFVARVLTTPPEEIAYEIGEIGSARH